MTQLTESQALQAIASNTHRIANALEAMLKQEHDRQVRRAQRRKAVKDRWAVVTGRLHH